MCNISEQCDNTTETIIMDELVFMICILGWVSEGYDIFDFAGY